MAPSTHAPKGFAIGALLHLALAPAGLGWLAWILTPPLAWASHLLADMVPHFEFIHFLSQGEFERTLAVDPKRRIKRIGWWPALTVGGRDKLRRMEGCTDLADPQPLEVPKQVTLLGGINVLLAIVIAVGFAWLNRSDPSLALIGLWGAGWAVAPDLLLVRPIYERGIKWNPFFSQDYLHHYIHCDVLVYELRGVGAVLEMIFFYLFVLAAWNISTLAGSVR